MLPPRFQKPANYLLLLTALKSLLGVGIVRKAQNRLSREVLNNFASDNTWDWPQEIMVVTGGCSGIGDHTVRQFAKRCIKVVVVDVVPPKKPFPANAFFYALDVTSSVGIHAVAGKIRKEVGEPTVLVNNAGIRTCKAILEETEEQIRRTFDVNIIAHFLLVREFLPYRIRRNHGHVVTIASLASFLVHARNVDYTCTKAAALAFHEGLSAELKNHYEAPKVRTTVVHPTWVRTPMIALLEKNSSFREFTLDPSTVADAIVGQIFKGEGAQLVLPGRHNWMSSIRAWPGWAQNGLRNSVAGMLPRNI